MPTTENGLVVVGATTCTVLLVAVLDFLTNFGVIAWTVTGGV
jgi:type IV secretory pathway TrbD component